MNRYRRFPCALVVATALLGACIGTATANAEPISTSMEADVALLSEKLSSDSTLSGFGSYSGAEKAQIERALAFVKAEGDQYVGTSATLESNLDSTIFKAGTAADTAIAADESAINGGIALLPDAGTTVEAIAGEAGALATAAAWLPVIDLLPIAATLGYEDITTGTNSVYIALFGLTEDEEKYRSEELASEEDVAAEQLSWVYFPRMPHCSGGSAKGCTEIYEYIHMKCPGGGPAYKINTETWTLIGGNCEFSEHTNRFGENQETRTGAAFHSSSETPNPFEAREMYMLEPRIAGKWYLGSVAGRLQTHEIPGNEITTELKHWLSDDLACLGGGAGVPSVAGYPSEIGPEILVGGVQEHFCKDEGRGLEYATTTVRAPTRFHDGLPKHLSKGEEEALEPGGHAITHVTGKVIEGSELAAAVKRMQDALEEGGARRLEEALKHWLEGAEPGTPLPGTEKVLSCSGTGAACKTAMEGAGFKDVHLHTLEWKNANLTVAAGDVTTISPTPGTYAELSAEISITENPSATDVANLVSAWEENNPEVELTSEEWKVIAASCLKTADKAILALSQCQTLPVFVPGNDIATAAEHDEKAIAGQAAWVKLEYESGASKAAKSEVRANETCPGEKPGGSSCDEYPYYSSAQGGLGHSPSVEWINATDNMKEGTFYSSFLSSCLSFTEKAPFLVVPTQITPTLNLCNK